MVRSLMIPGSREPNTLTRRQPGSMGAAIDAVPTPAGAHQVDAATILEREREGGGGPSQRPAPHTDNRA